VVSSQDDLDKLEHIHSNWQNWPTAQGRITCAKITTEPAANGEDYDKLQVTFRYHVNEVLYENTQSWYVAGRAEEKKYPECKTVTVHYDLAEPQISVIEPAKVPEVWVSVGQVYAPAIVFGILVPIIIWANIWPHERRTEKWSSVSVVQLRQEEIQNAREDRGIS